MQMLIFDEPHKLSYIRVSFSVPAAAKTVRKPETRACCPVVNCCQDRSDYAYAFSDYAYAKSRTTHTFFRNNKRRGGVLRTGIREFTYNFNRNILFYNKIVIAVWKAIDSLLGPVTTRTLSDYAYAVVKQVSDYAYAVSKLPKTSDYAYTFIGLRIRFCRTTSTQSFGLRVHWRL